MIGVHSPKREKVDEILNEEHLEIENETLFTDGEIRREKWEVSHLKIRCAVIYLKFMVQEYPNPHLQVPIISSLFIPSFFANYNFYSGVPSRHVPPTPLILIYTNHSKYIILSNYNNNNSNIYLYIHNIYLYS